MSESSLINLTELRDDSPPTSPRLRDAATSAPTAGLFAPAPPPYRGGLPPGVRRRVHEFIEAHLEKSIALRELAGIARLSSSHFARAFRQSAGVSPHDYLMQRRVARAQDLLGSTDLALSEIAIACGFADQSHFSRRFKERLGITPSRYRWLTR
jgi:transcriptional regulator GlxA family with amidase domain